MREMTAVKSFKYGTRRLLPGDVFAAKESDARLLIAVKKAKERRIPGRIEPPPSDLMTKVSAPSDIAALRVEYENVFSRRPFMGWDAATLREKIDAAKSRDL